MLLFLYTLDKEKKLMQTKGQSGANDPRLISIAAAKYCSEDAATLVHFTIAIGNLDQLMFYET